MKAIYPGTFDPVTFGHIDLIKRASNIFPELIVAIAENKRKKPFFSLDERLSMLEASIKDFTNIEIKTFNNLLINFVEENKSIIIIRGLRAVSDFEYEFQMALMNKKMAPAIETFFMMPDEKYTYLSSKEIKEIARLNGDVSKFVPEHVQKGLIKKITNL